MIERIKHILLFPEDAADEQEVIDGIAQSVDFRGAEAQSDTLQTQVLAIIATEGPLTAKNKSQLSDWLTQRIGQQQVRIILEAED